MQHYFHHFLKKIQNQLISAEKANFISDYWFFFANFWIIFPKMLSFPLIIWKNAEKPTNRQIQHIISKNRWFPLIIWFSIQNLDFQRILSGKEIIFVKKNQKSYVMTHRFCRFFDFSKNAWIQPISTPKPQNSRKSPDEREKREGPCSHLAHFSPFRVAFTRPVNTLTKVIKILIHRKKGEKSPDETPRRSHPICDFSVLVRGWYLHIFARVFLSYARSNCQSSCANLYCPNFRTT